MMRRRLWSGLAAGIAALAVGLFLPAPGTTHAQAGPANTPTLTPIPRAEVIVKTASPAAVPPGGIIDYTVTLRLQSDRQDVQIEDIFSGGVDLVQGTLRLNGAPSVNVISRIAQPPTNPVRVTYRFGLGNLPAGTHTLTFQGQVRIGIECHQRVQNEVHLVLPNIGQAAFDTVDTSLICETPTATSTATPTSTPGGETPTATSAPPTETPGGGEEGGGGEGPGPTSTPAPTEIPSVAGATPEAAAATSTPEVAGVVATAVPAETPTPIAAPTETPEVAGVVAVPPPALTPEVAGVVSVLPSAGEGEGGFGEIPLFLALAGLMTVGAAYLLKRWAIQ